jgi:hypothetical protein
MPAEAEKTNKGATPEITLLRRRRWSDKTLLSALSSFKPSDDLKLEQHANLKGSLAQYPID